MVHANQCAQICSVQEQENCQPGHVEKWNAIQEGQVAMNSINGKGNDHKSGKAEKGRLPLIYLVCFFQKGLWNSFSMLHE